MRAQPSTSVRSFRLRSAHAGDAPRVRLIFVIGCGDVHCDSLTISLTISFSILGGGMHIEGGNGWLRGGSRLTAAFLEAWSMTALRDSAVCQWEKETGSTEGSSESDSLHDR